MYGCFFRKNMMPASMPVAVTVGKGHWNWAE